MAALRKAFDKFDADKTGSLNLAQWKKFAATRMAQDEDAKAKVGQLLSELAEESQDKFFDAVFLTADKSHNHTISFAEFVEFVQHHIDLDAPGSMDDVKYEYLQAQHDAKLMGAASKDAQHEEVLKLLAEGVHVDYRDPKSGYTALMFAGGMGPTNVQPLLDAKADIHIKDENGWDPLCWAACVGNPDGVRRLLAAKADPNINNEAVKTQYLASGHAPPTLAKLQAMRGVTPLQLSAVRGQVECCAILIMAGADVSHKNKNKLFTTARKMAKMKKRNNVVELLDAAAAAKQANDVAAIANAKLKALVDDAPNAPLVPIGK